MLPGRINKNLAIGISAILFAAVLLWWYFSDHYPASVAIRIPGMDNRPKVEPRSDSVIIGEFLDTLDAFDESSSRRMAKIQRCGF